MKTILLIEDEKGLSLSLSNTLQEAGMKCIAVSSGEEGLSYITSNRPLDLILLDLILPGMSGVEVLKDLKSNSQVKDIPVIVLTNVESEKTIADIIAIAKTDYLVKSNYTLDEVVQRVKRKMEEYEQKRKGVEV